MICGGALFKPFGEELDRIVRARRGSRGAALSEGIPHGRLEVGRVHSPIGLRSLFLMPKLEGGFVPSGHNTHHNLEAWGTTRCCLDVIRGGSLGEILM